MTGSTALNESRRAAELAALADGEKLDVIVIGGGITGTGIALDAATRGLSRGAGGEARSGVRHQPVELQAGARRPAVSGDRQCRHRPAQRHRTRNPDDPQRPSPRQGDAAAGSAAAVDEYRERGRWCAPVSGRRRAAQAGGHAGIDAAAVPRGRRRARHRAGARCAPRRVDRRPARLRRAADRRRPPGHRRGAHGGPARRPHPDPRRRIERHRHLGDD